MIAWLQPWRTKSLYSMRPSSPYSYTSFDWLQHTRIRWNEVTWDEVRWDETRWVIWTVL